MSSIEVRDVRATDRAGWEPVWRGYLTFYRTSLPDEVTDDLFRRLLDPASPVLGLVAVRDGEVVGLAHVVVGPNTWSPRLDGYLEDLATHPDHRGTGVGRALVEAVVARGRTAGWRRVHWLTEESNTRARHLYDRVATLTEYVRYAVELDEHPT